MINVPRAFRNLLFAVCLLALSLPMTSRAEVNPAATALAWSPDGTLLAVGGSDGVTLYTPDLAISGQLPDSRADISALAWNNDGSQLAAGRYDGLVRVWDVADSSVRYTLHGHIGAVNAIAWGVNNRLLATAGDDLTVRVWADTDQIASMTKHRDRVYALAWGDRSSRILSGGADNAVWLWQEKSWEVLPTPQYHTRAVYAVAWNADGSLYATAGADKSIRLGKPNGSSLGGYTGHTDRIIALAWRPDGTLLSASWDHTIRQWTQGTREGKILIDTLPDRVRVVAFSPDGTRYALISAEGTLHVQALP
ncbi:MAG: WD40 repeat domain-containing protein [Anaerolineae bacterium]|nr:WD40 repeat domain-containing protein [Anaerolineae bacterium]